MELVPYPNSSGIMKTIGHPESVLVLRRRFWPLGRVSCARVLVTNGAVV
jgi:hypothetical protein